MAQKQAVLAKKSLLHAHSSTCAAFTAEGRAPSAVVCLAFEGRPDFLVRDEFGTFETWTEANAVAAELNRALGISCAEARQIVTSAALAARITPLSRGLRINPLR